TGADSKWQIDVEHSSWRFTNVGSLAVSTSANRLAGGGARPTFGSPALRNGEYCYFHRRWRMTTVDLSHSAHHVTTEFVLPVIEDADSIQITLGQIMRMIVCRRHYSPLFTTKSSRSARAFTSGARDLAWICL